MALEREYNVPLRKEWLKVPRYKRAKKAVKALKEFLAKHMKADFNNIKLSKWINQEIWRKGIKNPPHHIKIKAVKDEKGIVNVELVILPKWAIEEKERVEKEGKEKHKKEEKAGEKKEEKEKKEKTGEEKEEEEKEKKEKEKILHKEMPKPKPGMAEAKKTQFARIAMEK